MTNPPTPRAVTPRMLTRTARLRMWTRIRVAITANRLWCRVIGFAVWRTQRPTERMPWRALDLLALGRFTLAQLNAACEYDQRVATHAAEQAELAKRHAKPSSRRRHNV